MGYDTFRALVAEEHDGSVQTQLRDLGPDDLPDGDVSIQVAYSSLNYKDGLAVTGKGRVIRHYPMVPGIDLAGTVEASTASSYRPGDEVILTGWGSGETHWGGYTQRNRVQADWLVPLPDGMTAYEAMAIGTAGLTAMLSIMALEEYGASPNGRPILVTGATGGVGSFAVALLSGLGYSVTASTRSLDRREYLKELGAREIIDRSELAASKRPLESERWGGAVDAVGGQTLAATLPEMARGSAVAACGNVGGAEFSTTVFPFILRGIGLLGIDSNMCPFDRRLRAWQRLASDLPKDVVDAVSRTAPLAEVPMLSKQILRGEINGRIVVDINA